MLKSCPYCGKIHDPHVICDKKPVYSHNHRIRTDADALRHTGLWKNKSLEIRRRDHVCKVCWARGIITTKQLSVHHIVPLNENKDLWLDNDNLITLCERCHKQADNGEIDRDVLRDLAASAVKISPRSIEVKI